MSNFVCAANETNSISPELFQERMEIKRKVYWTEPGLVVERLRLLSDQGFPYWDVSYCCGRIGKELVEVQLPFSQLPKRGMRAALYREARATGRFIPGLFDSISTLN
jgi:hypothetical protein